MKLNHINLTVHDVKETVQFFEQYFHFKCAEVKGDNALAVLYGADGFCMVIATNAFNRLGNNRFPDAFHVGFFVESPELVDQKYQELIAGGEVAEHTPRNMHGSYGFYLHAPGNILVEVSCPN